MTVVTNLVVKLLLFWYSFLPLLPISLKKESNGCRKRPIETIFKRILIFDQVLTFRENFLC